MNIQQLEYIIAVDQFKSFSKAADYCNITQATLSTMVKKIEQELDVVIFDRKSNQVFTTDNGVEVIKIAKKSLVHINQLKDIAQSKNKTLQGKVKIGIIPTVAGSLLPIILRPLIEKYFDLYFEIIEMTTASIIKSLKTGDIDVGIISTPYNEDEIEEEILYYESLMIYGDDQGDK
jgi:LysR family hydrogen peroxide-inducible transcriptional activator